MVQNALYSPHQPTYAHFALATILIVFSLEGDLTVRLPLDVVKTLIPHVICSVITFLGGKT